MTESPRDSLELNLLLRKNLRIPSAKIQWRVFEKTYHMKHFGIHENRLTIGENILIVTKNDRYWSGLLCYLINALRVRSGTGNTCLSETSFFVSDREIRTESKYAKS